MKELVKTVFTARWKSFKTFKPSGSIKLHTAKNFIEFDFNDSCMLTIKAFIENNVEQLAHTDQWQIILKNNRHYLSVKALKLLYEVVTINHTVMVLIDRASDQKIFFAKEMYWQDHLKSNHTIVI